LISSSVSATGKISETFKLNFSIFLPISIISTVLSGQLQTIGLEEGLDATDYARRSNKQLSQGSLIANIIVITCQHVE
jgi:hypothetical protein